MDCTSKGSTLGGPFVYLLVPVCLCHDADNVEDSSKPGPHENRITLTYEAKPSIGDMTEARKSTRNRP